MTRKLSPSWTRLTALFATLAVFAVASPRLASAALRAAEEPQISAGAEAAAALEAGRTTGSQSAWSGITNPITDTLIGGPNWDAIKFFDVALLTGFFNIPPDPIGSAGPDRNIDVVNTAIESWDKTGVLQWRASLQTFVSPLVGTVPGTLGTGTFDPKIVYDHQAGRFVVCCLERVTTAPGSSRILVAVSKTSSPASATAADWNYYAIDSRLVIAGAATFADYPGLEVDEEAIYITTNQFRFTGGTFAGSRLWVINKVPFYAGGPAVHTLFDPYAAVPGSVATTTMPALVFGAAGAGPGIGTYLCSYSGLNDGVFEYIQMIRVNNPLGATTFTGEFINIGTIDNVALALPRGLQSGSPIGIDSGDRRVYDAVWRNNNLWFTATTLPLAGPNTGQTTTHWWRVSTAAVVNDLSPAGLLTLGDSGEAGADDVAPAAQTAWSGIAVNSLDEMKLTYAVFAPTIFPSSGVAGRQPSDPPGTLQQSVIVRAGLAPYVRTFTAGSTGRNRWGDYSGMCVDPTDDRTFWSFNEYADVRGNPTNVGGTIEDGQWATAWASCSFACATVECPPEVTARQGDQVVLNFCIRNCATLPDTYVYTVNNAGGWCIPVVDTVTIPGGGTFCFADTCLVPPGAVCGFHKPVVLTVYKDGVLVGSCTTTIFVDCEVPTRLTTLEAEGQDGGVMLHWTMSDVARYQGFQVYREEGNTGRVQVTDRMLTGGPEFSFFDAHVASAAVNYWLEEIALDGTTQWHGPIAVTGGTPLPTAVSFAPARPNPFGEVTSFSYALPRAANVRLTVFDAAGHLVRTIANGVEPAGTYTKTWDGSDASGRRAPVGIYMVVLNAGGEVHRQKVLLGR